MFNKEDYLNGNAGKTNETAEEMSEMYTEAVDFPIDRKEILDTLQGYYDKSMAFSTTKRNLFQSRDERYLAIVDESEKIYVRYVWSIMQTLISLYYLDRPTVQFTGRQLSDEQIGENLNAVAEFDYEEMNCDVKKRQVQEDKFNYGVGIEVFDIWNKEEKHPEYKVFPAYVWVPDPDQDVNYEPEYHGFEASLANHELDCEEYMEVDNLKLEYSNWQAAQTKQYESAVNQTRGLIDFKDGSGRWKILYWFINIKDKKYFVVTDINMTSIMKFEEIKSAGKGKPEFPVITRWWSPKRGDPYGTSIWDIVGSEEQAMEIFINLNRIKAEFEAFGDTFIYDKDSVDDPVKLKRKGKGTMYVSGDLKNGMPVQPVPRSAITSDAYQMPDILRNLASSNIGLDDRSLGVSPSNNMSATENQRVQKNANLKLVLGMRMDSIAEKKFWKVWYSFYQKYMSDVEEKVFLLRNDLGNDYFKLEKNKFVSNNSIDIKIESVSEVEDRNAKRQAAAVAVAQFVVNDPAVSEVGKRYFKMDMLKKNGYSDAELKYIYGETYEEMIGNDWVELLNYDEEPPKLSDVDTIDVRALLTVIDKAADTDAKWKYVQYLKNLMKEKMRNQQGGGQWPVNPGEQAASGENASNMMLNNMIQSQNSAPQTAEALTTIWG